MRGTNRQETVKKALENLWLQKGIYKKFQHVCQMGFKDWHTPFWTGGDYWMNKLGYAFKAAAYGLSQNRTVATGITRQYLRMWNRKESSHQRIYSSPFGKALNASIRRSPRNAVWLWDSLSDNRRQCRKHLCNWNTIPIFSSWGLWFLFLLETALGDIFVLCSPWTGQRSSGGIEGRGVQTIWKLSSSFARYEFLYETFWWLAVWWKRPTLAINDQDRRDFLEYLYSEKMPTGRMYLRLPQFKKLSQWRTGTQEGKNVWEALYIRFITKWSLFLYLWKGLRAVQEKWYSHYEDAK